MCMYRQQIVVEQTEAARVNLQDIIALALFLCPAAAGHSRTRSRVFRAKTEGGDDELFQTNQPHLLTPSILKAPTQFTSTSTDLVLDQSKNHSSL